MYVLRSGKDVIARLGLAQKQRCKLTRANKLGAIRTITYLCSAQWSSSEHLRLAYMREDSLQFTYTHR